MAWKLQPHRARALEQIGSSSVVGLLAKPIVDLAFGLVAGEDLARITSALAVDGWVYRGDAGDSGGHVFVLDSRPQHRVAHLHAVDLGGTQWVNYLRLRPGPTGRTARPQVLWVRTIVPVHVATERLHLPAN